MPKRSDDFFVQLVEVAKESSCFSQRARAVVVWCCATARVEVAWLLFLLYQSMDGAPVGFGWARGTLKSTRNEPKVACLQRERFISA